MTLIKNKKDILNLIIAALPISIAIGNLFVNINILLIIIFGVIIFKSELFFLKKNLIKYLLLLFFLFLILTTLFEYYSAYEPFFHKEEYVQKTKFNHLIKSFLFLRYFLLTLVICKLAETGNFNIKYLFYTSAFITVFLFIDMFVQSIFGKDLFLIERPSKRYTSGFFGRELIAGGFIQKFSLFLILLVPFSKLKMKTNIILFFFVSFISIYFLILSGNRMVVLLFFASIFALFIMEKRIKFLIVFSIFIFCISAFFYNTNISTKNKFNYFYSQAKLVLINFPYAKDPYLDNKSLHHAQYLAVFNTGYDYWEQKKLFGNGLKNIRIKCYDLQEKYKKKFRSCSTHPHNYHLEILGDTGVVGYFIFILISFLILKNYYFFYEQQRLLKIKSRFLSLAPFLILLMEFFPIRSSGSFFSTNNSVIIFLMIAIVISKRYIKNK